jgi:ATP-dependent DNA helicase Q1
MACSSSNDEASEIREIDIRLGQISNQVDQLEQERQLLVLRKKKLVSQLKESLPSSVGGRASDTSAAWSRSDYSWSYDVDMALRKTFHMSSLRPLQLETINVTMSGIDCLLVLPTGGGKSLCFQLPALIDKNGVTLVVSPLVSLIEDQLWLLKSLSGCSSSVAECLNASSSKEHVKQVHEAMLNASSPLRLLYVTPEKLAKSKMFMNKLEKMHEVGRYRRLVIDEVHCVSTFGHDFRPDYKFLGVMKRLFPKVPILGLTATATQQVIDDVKKVLNIEKCVLFKSCFNRVNLFYEVCFFIVPT